MKKSKKKAVKKAIAKDMKKKDVDMVAKQTDETPKKKTYQKKQKPVMARPKYLNWKIYDNFEKINDDNLFLDGKLEKSLTPKQWHDLKEKTQQLRDKYGPILRDLFAQWEGQKRDRLVIAGGNYTFFFVLPQAVSWIQKKFPDIGVELKLFESATVDLKNLKEQDADIILTGSYSGFPGFTSKELEVAGYVKVRKKNTDAMYFAASKDAIEKFGSQENVLQYHNILFSRLYGMYALNQESVEMHRLYSVIPKNRGQFPRLITDQFFLEHVMAQRGVGIGNIYTSMRLPEGYIRLNNEPLERFERFAIVKRTLDKKYHAIARRLIDILAHRGK